MEKPKANIDTCCFKGTHVESFDYTEWRKDNLFQGMTVEQISDAAMEYRRTRTMIPNLPDDNAGENS